MSKIHEIKKTCPECGSVTLHIWGCMWDIDHVVCSDRGCNWEENMPFSTLEDGTVLEVGDE